MRIKFKAPDPRAGTIAQMDSSRGQHFIDTGAAVLVKDDGGNPTIARAELDKAIASLPGENTDAEYVVRAMRSHFGDLFTEADEAKVREVVKAPPAEPSEALNQPVEEAAATDVTKQGEAAKTEEKPAAETRTKKAAEPKNKGA